MSDNASDSTLFACDVGNTRVGIALVRDGQIRQTVRVPLAGLSGLATCFRLDSSSSAERTTSPVIVSSVNPEATESLRKMVGQFTSGPFLVARQDFPVLIETAVDQAEAVGVDRLLAALAARELVRDAAIVVDVGTAMTVDAVDAGGRFLGGAILPGPTLGAWALHQKTAALPEVALDAPIGAVGANTEEAIRSGLILGAAGAIERLVAEQRKALGSEVRVLATGGGLFHLASVLTCFDEVRPDLVLEGLVVAYLGQS